MARQVLEIQLPAVFGSAKMADESARRRLGEELGSRIRREAPDGLVRRDPLSPDRAARKAPLASTGGWKGDAGRCPECGHLNEKGRRRLLYLGTGASAWVVGAAALAAVSHEPWMLFLSLMALPGAARVVALGKTKLGSKMPRCMTIDAAEILADRILAQGDRAKLFTPTDRRQFVEAMMAPPSQIRARR